MAPEASTAGVGGQGPAQPLSMSGRRSDWRPGLLAVLWLLALPAGVLAPLWVSPICAGEDDVVYYLPLRMGVGDALAKGAWRGVTPLAADGTPLMADPQAALMHPLTWLFAVLDPSVAYSLSIFAAFWTAGLGGYVYLRRAGLGVAGAVFGATALQLCGFLVGHRVHLSMLLTAAAFPWGLWCIEWARHRRGVALLAATPVFALALAAGHWAILVYMALGWAGYFAFRGRPVLPAAAVLVVAGALAVAWVAPQLEMTLQVMAQANRQRIGYATAGENSFFPLAGLMAVLPMLFGSRTPGFYPQPWWGPWHLCEMLGYVGITTLALAGGAVAAFWRRAPAESAPAANRRSLVRAWTVLAIVAGVWMLGYYLPTYRLVHALPVFGSLRCPARMVLVVDMALAVLAAVAVDAACDRQLRRPARARLARWVRRIAGAVLPLVWAAGLALLGVGAWALWNVWKAGAPLPIGGAAEAAAALHPGNPAIWVPLALLAASAGVLGLWLRWPRAGLAALLVLLAVDLASVARFVDIPPDYDQRQVPPPSPAAEWMRNRRLDVGTFAVWGLSREYNHRPAELLLPQTSAALGIRSVGNYGPFQTDGRVHLLATRAWGQSPAREELIRRNELLTRLGVRYLLCEAGDEVQQVLRSAASHPAPAAPADWRKLAPWWATRATPVSGGHWLRAPAMWLPASMRAYFAVDTPAPGRWLWVSFSARGGPDGAAGDLFLNLRPADSPQQANLLGDGGRVPWSQIAEGTWRRFLRAIPAPAGGIYRLEISTRSERALQVGQVRVALAPAPGPVAPGRAGPLYRKVAELPAVHGDDPNVVIYENRRWSLAGPAVLDGDEPAREALRWAWLTGQGPKGRPAKGFDIRPPGFWRGLAVSFAAVLTYLGCAGFLARRWHRRRTTEPRAAS